MTKHQKQKAARRKHLIAKVSTAIGVSPEDVTDKHIGTFFGNKSKGKFGGKE